MFTGSTFSSLPTNGSLKIVAYGKADEVIGLEFFSVSVSSRVAYNKISLAGGPTRDDYDVLFLVSNPQHARKRLGCALL